MCGLEVEGAQGGEVAERVCLDGGERVGAEVEELEFAQVSEAVLVDAREVVGREHERLEVRELVEGERFYDVEVGALAYCDLVKCFLVDERGQ
jgi:hypothetical protein